MMESAVTMAKWPDRTATGAHHRHTMPPSVTPTVSTEEVLSTVDPLSTVDLVNYIVNVYIDGLLCIFGFAGNILILLVLPRDRRPNSNRVLLQAMAMFDTAFLVYVFLYVVMRSLAKYTGEIPGYGALDDYIKAFVLPMGWTAQTCIIWTVMMIAIDRYLMLSYPLQARVWCRSSRACWSILAMMVTAILFNVPRWPYYYLVAFHSHDTNSTFVSHIDSGIDHFNEDLYQTIYSVGLTIVFLFIIPLTVIITLNVLLVKNLKAAAEHRTSTLQMVKKREGETQKLTKLVIIIITTFILCQLPDFIASIIGAGLFDYEEGIYEYYAPFKEMLLVLNSSINIILYCIFFDRFRNTLSKMLGCDRHQSSSNSQVSVNRQIFYCNSQLSEHFSEHNSTVAIISVHNSRSSGLNYSPQAMEYAK